MCLFSSGVTGRLSLPSSVVLVQQEERFTKGLGEGVQTLIAGALVAQELLTCRGGGQCDLTLCRGSFYP